MGGEMKFFGIEISRNRLIHALFGWSMLLPEKTESDKPFVAKTTSNETEEESWIEPLNIAEDSVLRQTDPILMTRQERRESTIRYWMERKEYDKKEIEKPLTDERLKEIGRGSRGAYDDLNRRVKEKLVKEGGRVAQAILLDRPSDLDLGIIEKV
jgi:hypothetical protein